MSHPPNEIHERDRFGYIPFAFQAECGDYIIESLPDLDDKVVAVESYANPDGYYYPPQQTTHSPDPITEKIIPIPRTTRPALLHQLPATHTIRHRDGEALPATFRDQDGALVINLLALIYRTRCQFANWWFDGRVRVKRDRVAWFEDTDHTLSTVLTRVFDTWEKWPADRRVPYINALWMHSRAASYEFEWERFLSQYLTLDAAWAAARTQRGTREPKHLERIDALCSRFGLFNNPKQAGEIVRLRNDLFHEALWDMRRPSAALADVCLGNLNSRLLLAMGGVRGAFVRSNWASISTVTFGLE